MVQCFYQLNRKLSPDFLWFYHGLSGEPALVFSEFGLSFWGNHFLLLVLQCYRCHPCTGTAVCEAAQWIGKWMLWKNSPLLALWLLKCYSVWPTKAAVPLQWRGWAVVGVGAETELKLMFFGVAQLLCAPSVWVGGQMDVHQHYLSVNVGQNPLKRCFFALALFWWSVSEAFQFLCCLLLVSRPYETLLQHCHITVTVCSMSICQMVGYFYIFDDTNIFFEL